MIKRKLFASLITFLSISFIIGGKAFAFTFHTPDNPGYATITINDKNTGSNYAYATGVVGKFLKGGYEPSSDDFFVTGAVDASVHNGQKIEVFIPEGSEQGTFIVTVYTKYVSSKNEPTTPSKPSDPKTTTTTKPKKPNTTNNSTQTSNSKDHTSSSVSTHKSNKNTHTSDAKTNNSSSKRSDPKRIIVKTDKNGSDSNKNKKTSDTKTVHTQNKSLGKMKPYTLAELKEKGAKVIKEEGRYFAVVDGIKQEITEDEAKKLGYKEDRQDNGNQDKGTLKNMSNKENNNSSKNDSKESKITATKVAGVATGGVAVVTGGTVGALYYFGHPGTRELFQKIIDFLLKWRK